MASKSNTTKPSRRPRQDIINDWKKWYTNASDTQYKFGYQNVYKNKNSLEDLDWIIKIKKDFDGYVDKVVEFEKELKKITLIMIIVFFQLLNSETEID